MAKKRKGKERRKNIERRFHRKVRVYLASPAPYKYWSPWRARENIHKMALYTPPLVHLTPSPYNIGARGEANQGVGLLVREDPCHAREPHHVLLEIDGATVFTKISGIGGGIKQDIGIEGGY